MIEIEKENNRKPRALLVGEPGNDLQELKGLVLTLGMDVIQRLTLNRLEIHPAYGMGTGKAEEINQLAHEIEADCIIFDFNLEPRKQRNWEELTKLSCFDRQEVIIRIFAQRAQTKEAVLQVELARLNYSLPRLSHMNNVTFSRQRGGAFGNKGSGETQLELNQRLVRERIVQTKKELAEIELNRQTQRKQRGKYPTCSLVGYTNAGKSSLLNALTGADAYVENQLFATLDPLTRKMSLNESAGVLLTDTVGFISNLPHHLIDAFKSTLEESVTADLLLIVLDSSDENALFQYETVCNVLQDIGADKNPRMILLNKVDKGDEKGTLTTLRHKFPDALCISAKDETGFIELKDKIYEILFGELCDYIIPPTQVVLINELRKSGCTLTEEWLDDGVHITARTSGRLAALASPFIVHAAE